CLARPWAQLVGHLVHRLEHVDHVALGHSGPHRDQVVAEIFVAQVRRQVMADAMRNSVPDIRAVATAVAMEVVLAAVRAAHPQLAVATAGRECKRRGLVFHGLFLNSPRTDLRLRGSYLIRSNLAALGHRVLPPTRASNLKMWQKPPLYAS